RPSGVDCALPTGGRPLHSPRQPDQRQRARSHLGGKRLSLPSSQRTCTPPSGETATSVGRTGATCGLILSRRPMVLVTISHRMLRSERLFQAVALPYALVTRHPVWERDCARMASELRPGCRAILLEPRDGIRAGTGLLRALPRPGWAITALLWRTMSGFYGWFTAADLRTLLEAAGLRVVKLDEALDGLGLLAVAER